MRFTPQPLKNGLLRAKGSFMHALVSWPIRRGMQVTKPRVLVTNIMMLKEKARFDRAIKDLGYEPVWTEVDQFLTESRCLQLVGEID